MPLEQRRRPGFSGDHGRPHTQFVAGDRDGKLAFAIGEALVIGTAEQVNRAEFNGSELIKLSDLARRASGYRPSIQVV